MATLTLSGISHAFSHRELLHSINLTISSGDRIALTGANGSGKTTLMRIMAGELFPDLGKVSTEKGTTVAYLPQSVLQSPAGDRKGIVRSGF